MEHNPDIWTIINNMLVSGLTNRAPSGGITVHEVDGECRFTYS